MRTTLFSSSAFLLTLCSCTLGTWIAGEAQPDAAVQATPSYDYSPFYQAFDNPWVGKSRDELVEALGPPDAIYEARHRFADFDASIPASTYIYTDNFENSRYCVDAYVIDQPTATVIKYYCR